jgi:serine/threonine-protein kinase
MDKPVAVKVLRQELASDTEAVARFHREARSASRLDHDHIIRVTDFGQTDDGLLFLVMELLDGENLAQVLRRGPLPWRRAATITRDIALGLAHAHEQGVIHRDLKPENIILQRRGKARQQVKVLDFGLAKLMHRPNRAGPEPGHGPDAQPEEDPARQSLTRTGVVFGTPEYMSPEQAEGRPPGPQTDLYALGVVCFQMVTGQTPFVAPTFLLLIAKTVSEPPPYPSRLNPDAGLPAELEQLILRCLAKAPEDRPGSAEELAEELDLLLAHHPDEALRTGEVAASGGPGHTPPAGRVRARELTVPGVGSQPPAGRSSEAVGPSKSGPAPASSPSAPTLTGPAPAAAAPPGGVAKTVPRNLAPGQVPYGASPPSSAVASAYAALGDKARPPGADDEAPARARSLASGSLPASPRVPVKDPVQDRDRDRDPEPGPEAAPPPGPPRAATELAPPSAASDEGPDDEALKVPRRPYWAVALLGLVACIAALSFAVPRWLRKPPPPPAGTDELRKVRELLSPERVKQPGAVDEAIRLLLIERQSEEQGGRTTPRAEIQRLLSQAYEAQQNRLRALGHMYMAVRLGGEDLEGLRSQLALAQLLVRMGHELEACRTAQSLLRETAKPQPRLPVPALNEVRVPALALAATLRCDAR